MGRRVVCLPERLKPNQLVSDMRYMGWGLIKHGILFPSTLEYIIVSTVLGLVSNGMERMMVGEAPRVSIEVLEVNYLWSGDYSSSQHSVSPIIILKLET